MPNLVMFLNNDWPKWNKQPVTLTLGKKLLQIDMAAILKSNIHVVGFRIIPYLVASVISAFQT